jgi:glutathione S-transferase
MLVLHAHPLSSYCWKVLIALYEKGIAFEFRLLDFGDEAAAAEFRRIWPIGRMPLLADGERHVFEASVIIEHLDLHHPGGPRLVPTDPEAALPVRMLDRIFDNYVMAPMQKIVLDRLRPAGSRDAAGVEDARRLIDTAYGWLEDRLAAQGWAAGADFTLADCAAAPSLHYADKVRPLGERFPGVSAYLERVRGRPSFARVLKEAEPYAHMFPAES